MKSVMQCNAVFVLVNVAAEDSEEIVVVVGDSIPEGYFAVQ